MEGGITKESRDPGRACQPVFLFAAFCINPRGTASSLLVDGDKSLTKKKKGYPVVVLSTSSSYDTMYTARKQDAVGVLHFLWLLNVSSGEVESESEFHLSIDLELSGEGEGGDESWWQ